MSHLGIIGMKANDVQKFQTEEIGSHIPDAQKFQIKKMKDIQFSKKMTDIDMSHKFDPSSCKDM